MSIYIVWSDFKNYYYQLLLLLHKWCSVLTFRTFFLSIDVLNDVNAKIYEAEKNNVLFDWTSYDGEKSRFLSTDIRNYYSERPRDQKNFYFKMNYVLLFFFIVSIQMRCEFFLFKLFGFSSENFYFPSIHC